MIGISIGRGKALSKSQTGLALEVRMAPDRIAGPPRTMWIPISVIHDDSEVYEVGGDGDVVVAEWWADSKGFSGSKERVRR